MDSYLLDSSLAATFIITFYDATYYVCFSSGSYIIYFYYISIVLPLGVTVFYIFLGTIASYFKLLFSISSTTIGIDSIFVLSTKSIFFYFLFTFS